VRALNPLDNHPSRSISGHSRATDPHLTRAEVRRSLGETAGSLSDWRAEIQRRFSLPHSVLLAMAAVFAAASTLYAAAWMYDARYPGHQVELGFNHVHDEQYDPKTHSIAVGDVVPGSPAEQAGLRAGDQIIGVNGKMLTTSAPYDEAYAREKPGDKVDFTIVRPGVQEPIILHGIFRAVQSTQHEGLVKASAQQVSGSYPVLFLLVGFAVLFLRLEDPTAWLLALLFAGFIGAPDSSNSTLIPHAVRAYVDFYHMLFMGMLCPLFYIFFAVFPVRSQLDRRFPWLKWLSLAFGACLVLPGFWIGDMRVPGIAEKLVGTGSANLTRHFFVYGSYFWVALGMISLIGNATAKAAEPEVRRKSRVILWGTVFGVLPIVFERAAVDFFGYQPSFWIGWLFLVILLLYPLSFAYAVVKHRVMEIPVLLKRSARYVLVQRGFIVLLFAAAATAIALFTHTISRFFPEGTNIGMAMSAVFGIALVWVSAPIVKRGTERIDRAFFRSAYDARRILEDLAEKTRAVTDRHALANLLTSQVAGALHPKSLACYLEDGSGNLVVAGAPISREKKSVPAALPRPEFPFRFGALFVPREAEIIPAGMPLLAEIVQRGKVWDVPQGGKAADDLAPECLVPILGRSSGLIGLLVLGQRRSEEPYSSEDKHLLESVASQAGIALENIGLAEKMAERMEAERRVALEMDIARRVQARLFPQRLPELGTLDYAGGCVQAREVGGDYYDFLDMGPGALGIVLADISGKGMSGALLMANLQANLRSQYAVALDDLPQLLQSVNRLFYENTTDESYATMFFGVYDDSRRKLRYANCGHVAPLILRRDGSMCHLRSTTTVVGLFLKWPCPIEEETLHAGDLLIICTDGVTEAPDAQGEEYGGKRLAEIVRENRSLPVQELLTAIQANVQEFSGGTQADDVTLIVARCR
jgi:phosphoserine phosphatase RsbU/P